MTREIASPLSYAVWLKQQKTGDKNPKPAQPVRTQLTNVGRA